MDSPACQACSHLRLAAMNLFGNKKKSAAPPPPTVTAPAHKGPDSSSAIAKVRDTLETLEKREEHLQRKVDNEIKQAKAFSAANKKREAITCIKRKKMYEKQLDQLSNTKMTLETQRMAMENMNINKDALEAQRIANSAMKANMEAMGGVDAVEDTMADIEEGLQDADEIGEALGRGVNIPGMDADEDELLAELEGLEADDLAQELGNVSVEAAPEFASAPISMPAAPTSAAKAMTEEERELAELEASMAM